MRERESERGRDEIDKVERNFEKRKRDIKRYFERGGGEKNGKNE